MKLNQWQWLASLIIFLVLITTVLVMFSSADRHISDTENSAKRVQALTNTLQWRVGINQQYDVIINSSFVLRMSANSPEQPMNVDVNAALDYKTLEVTTEGAIVGMRFSSMDLLTSGVSDSDLNLALTQPFRVHMYASGLPYLFEFPGTLTVEHREIIENLVRTFQLVVKEGNTWVIEEFNASGQYEASYTRVSPTKLLKRKKHFLTSTFSLSGTIPDLVSEEVIRTDAANDWITEMNLTETLRSEAENEPSIVVKNVAKLKLRDGFSVNTKNKWDFKSTVTPAASNSKKSGDNSVISVEDAKKKLLVNLSALDLATEARTNFIHNLRDILLLDDTMPFVLIEQMKQQTLSDRTRADLFLALELSGNQAAQSALMTVFNDVESSSTDGMRAIVALGGVANPSNDAIDALWDLANNTSMETARAELPGTAALALGALARNLKSDKKNDYDSLLVGLFNGAQGASTIQQRAVFLHAIGNTADQVPSTRNNLVTFLDDPSPMVRSAAANTIGRLGVQTVGEQLFQSYNRESNDVVRGSLIQALSSWENPPSKEVESVRNNIHTEVDENVRLNMALLLNNSMETFPENRESLKKLLAGEKSKRIRQQLADLLYKPTNH